MANLPDLLKIAIGDLDLDLPVVTKEDGLKHRREAGESGPSDVKIAKGAFKELKRIATFIGETSPKPHVRVRMFRIVALIEACEQGF